MRKSDFTLPTLDDLFSTQADDFERTTITIKHIVTNAKIDGKCNGQYPDSAGHRADRLAHLSSCRKSCTPM